MSKILYFYTLESNGRFISKELKNVSIGMDGTILVESEKIYSYHISNLDKVFTINNDIIGFITFLEDDGYLDCIVKRDMHKHFNIKYNV